MNTPVDLRSDAATRPTEAMRAAMAAAPVGDDTYGEDPSVRALEDRVAGMLGLEAAMFTASGTQSNLCAILAHCQRGDEYIVGQLAHCYRWEGGGAAVLGSVQPQPLDHAPDMTLPLRAIEDAIKPEDDHFARTRLLALENTIHGRVLPAGFVAEATALAARHGLARHLDGARLFNAAVAQAGNGDPRDAARGIAGHFDSVSVCFSKGLGAPVGSALCGPAAFVRRARRVRKMVGGAMRQAGILAAAADYALSHNIGRLAEDHARARRLAEGVAGIEGLAVAPVDTNIVTIRVEPEAGLDGGRMLAWLREAGILATGLYSLRFVTHLGIDDAGIERAIAAIRAFAAAGRQTVRP